MKKGAIFCASKCKDSMRCTCGYDFREGAILPFKKRPFASYALIDNADYKKFLRKEMKVLEAKDEQERTKAIFKSLRYIGSVLVCPQCNALTVNWPDDPDELALRHFRPDTGS